MAQSTITVAGINPSLNILGATQQLNFNQPLSTLQINNISIPTSLISSQTNNEYRNYLSSGYRWIHLTSNSDTYGSLTLQNFVNAEVSASGNNMMAFNNSGVEILTPLNMNNQNITNLLDPTTNQQAATKFYVDDSTITLTGAITGTGNINTSISTTLTNITVSQISNYTSSTNALIAAASKPYGGLYMAANASATTVTTGGTYYKVAGTTSASATNNFSTSSNRLAYTGSTTANVIFQVALDASHDAVVTTNLTFAIFKNGTIVSTCAPIQASVLTTTNQPFSISGIISMATNDYIEVWVTSSSSTTNVTVTDLNFVGTVL